MPFAFHLHPPLGTVLIAVKNLESKNKETAYTSTMEKVQN